MARAMIGGMLKKELVVCGDVIASSATQKTADTVAEAFGIATTTDNTRVAKESDMIVLAVKPVFCEQVIREIRDEIREAQIIVTIVAGRSLDWLQKQFGGSHAIVRTMPNTPALVGEGITAVCPNELVSDEQLEQVLGLLESCGRAQVVPERLMDAVVAVSGSSPAYVFMFIEAMADAAVAEGMPRAQAYEFAAQSVLGSAKMVLETGRHPGELKDMVCSPAGTTIEAVKVLENTGFRGSVMQAMEACAAKNRKL